VLPKPLALTEFVVYVPLHQIFAHRTGTVFGQLLVHVIAADIIRVSTDFNVELRLGKQNTGDFRQLLPCARLQRILPRIKQYIGHADDKPACAVAGLENRIQLL
jgi:hypothetical protein